jgi:hypothetical protein
MVGISSELFERFRYGMEEVIIEQSLIKADHLVKLMGQGKDEVEVGSWQQQSLLGLAPLRLRQSLTLRTMAVATGVIHGSPRPTGLTLFKVAAQSCRATPHDVSHGFVLSCRQSMLGAIGYAVGSENVGYLSAAQLSLSCPRVC